MSSVIDNWFRNTTADIEIKSIEVVDAETVVSEEITDKAKSRKDMPVYSGVITYFPNALKEVSKVSLAGAKQHGQTRDTMHWDKTKSTDNTDALMRHLIDHSINPVDDDNMLHLAKVAWRALASLERYLEDNR